MSNVVIKAENVSKQYRLGQVGTGTLSHDLKRWWALARGKEDPFLTVGTGFNPELTGRDNIYMNGTILGMTKKEISRKFDEIVDFSGVEMYIDTPVKRYSSGMYVRLAFGVAAHLEPEILIVDEVLAVGDAEFQKKCLGKMGDVASHGRTVIFVSHNMQAVQALCRSTMYMKAGRLVETGPTERVISNYLNREVKNCIAQRWELADAPGNNRVQLLSAELDVQNAENNNIVDVGTTFDLKFEIYNHVDGANLNLSLPMDYSLVEMADVHQLNYPMFSFETANYFQFACPKCNSNDRDRLYALYIEKNFSNVPAGKKYEMLDVAPSPLAKYLKALPFVNYRSADLYHPADDKVDLCDMNIYEDGRWDIF
eukprot:gene14299-14092_t